MKPLLSATSYDVLQYIMVDSSCDETIFLPSAPSCDVMQTLPSTDSSTIIRVSEPTPNKQTDLPCGDFSATQQSTNYVPSPFLSTAPCDAITD